MELTNKPRVSVIIPTKNRCKALKECLDSLLKQTYKNFEVVIVDGGSTDRTKELINDYSNKLPIVFTTQNGGLIPQENKGWKIANGDIIIRTDDDVIASPEWIQEIVNTFDFPDGVGGVTGPTIIPEERKEYRDLFHFQKKLTQGGIFWKLIGKIYFDYFLEGEPFTVSKWFKSGAFSLGSNYPECLKLTEPIKVTHQEACNMATRKELLEKVGGYDETFIGIGEFNEPDVSFKIRKLGYKIIFNPKARVYHLPSKEGFFKDRPNSYGRILNFINFYFRHIKPNTLDKFVRFFSYLLFLNGFFIYKFITTRQINQLGCIAGTMVGLAKNIFKITSYDRSND
jgi:glycosyltransferase involved in cell wall biosynthesis